MTDLVAVRLGPSASVTRRTLGPLAWSALEVLATRPRPFADPTVVPMSVRALGAELDVATNTAQRALRTLRDAGLVEHAQRRVIGGRFDVATYRLAIPTDVLSIDEDASSKPPIEHIELKPPSSKRSPILGQQLVLLPS
jgi:hypothetical protein